jgi:hypothetical protein
MALRPTPNLEDEYNNSYLYLFFININLFNCSLIVFALYSLCVVCPLLFV